MMVTMTNTNHDMNDDFLELPEDDRFAERFAATLTDADKRRVEILDRVHDTYLRTRRDAELRKQIQFLVEGSLRLREGRRIEGRALIVIGESGAGKSWTVAHAVDDRPEFKPTGDFRPFVRFVAPRPCTLKQLGRELLRELGYAIERDLPEHITWEKVRERLKALRVRFVWIDEMQHAMTGTDVQKLRDTIKNVMQQNDWPVSFILSGLPTLVDFLMGDFQFQRRKRVIRLSDLEFPLHAQVIRWILENIVLKRAGMTLAAELTEDEFVHRLCYAGCGRFGMIVTLVRNALEEALSEKLAEGPVAIRHFATSYSALTGCEPAQNVFIAEQWEKIDPEPMLFKPDEDEVPAEPLPKTRRRGRGK
jgi:hypothetical protein